VTNMGALRIDRSNFYTDGFDMGDNPRSDVEFPHVIASRGARNVRHDQRLACYIGHEGVCAGADVCAERRLAQGITDGRQREGDMSRLNSFSGEGYE